MLLVISLSFLFLCFSPLLLCFLSYFISALDGVLGRTWTVDNEPETREDLDVCVCLVIIIYFFFRWVASPRAPTHLVNLDAI